MSFVDFGMMVGLEHEYDEYVNECKTQGVEPMSFQAWWDSLE